jgi:hypothetical protein
MEENHWPYKPATPVVGEPLPAYVRQEIHSLVRRGAQIVRVNAWEDDIPGQYSIVHHGASGGYDVSYVYPPVGVAA